MKDEILDALLHDHALGALSPEVTALLEEHLAQNPAASHRAASVQETVRLARAALATPLPRPQRSLDVGRLRRAQRPTWLAAHRTEILRLAACLLIGLGAGWLVRAPSPAPESGPPPIAFRHERAASPEPPLRFWSIARFAPDNARSENARGFRRASPAAAPVIPSTR